MYFVKQRTSQPDTAPELPWLMGHNTDSTPALHDKAIRDLAFIRRTIEGAASFTDVPGWGLVGMGVSAVATAMLADRLASAYSWFWLWFMEAAIAVLIGLTTMWYKMRRRGRTEPLGEISIPARKFLLGLTPAVVAGAIISAAILIRSPETNQQLVSQQLSGVWLLLYGVGIVNGGSFSVRAVPLMGIAFMILGTLTLISGSVSHDVAMGAGFGLVHIGFGLYIARRHGG